MIFFERDGQGVRNVSVNVMITTCSQVPRHTPVSFFERDAVIVLEMSVSMSLLLVAHRASVTPWWSSGGEGRDQGQPPAEVDPTT